MCVGLRSRECSFQVLVPGWSLRCFCGRLFCLFFALFCWQMAAADWKKELSVAGLPSKASDALLKMGYVTKMSYLKAFKSAEKLECLIKKLLLEDKVAGEVKPDHWECHPVAGILRGLWEVEQQTASAPAPAKPEVTALNWLGLGPSAKLEVSQLRELWVQFAKHYPSEWLDEHSRPCRQLIQQIWLQKREGDLRFIPGKFLISESQWERSKKTCEKKEASFVALLAEAAGQADHVESAVSPSPFAVQRALTLRGIAWALVSFCHLGAAHALARKFVSLYCQPVLPDLGLRPPTLAEAEAADAEVCRRLGEQINDGLSLVQAINEVVESSALLSSLLQLRPKLQKVPPPPPREVTKKRKADGPAGGPKSKACHQWQKEKKCRFGDSCKFLHQAAAVE